MKEYFMTLMSVALLNGILHMISPEGDIKKYVRLLGALCLLCAMTVPLFSALAEGEGSLNFLTEFGQSTEQSNYDEIYQNSLLNGNKTETEKNIKTRMIQELSIEASTFDVSAEIVLKNEKTDLESVTVTLRDSAIFADPRQIIEWINGVYGCSCVIVYE